ncbi:MAG: glycosyltransferase, partial [Paracoccaceae bacterium]
MGITTNKPAARCLDLTRLVSRVGRGPWTGIDRVEFEYLKVLVATDIPLFALVRIAGGQAVLEPENVKLLLARLDGSRQWGQPDLASRFLRKSTSTYRRAVSDIRRLSARVVRKAGLVANLGECFPAGTAYLNVGHSNISKDVLSAFRSIPGTRITVLLHDTIPLDFPQYQRPKTVSTFSVMLRLMAEYSDLILCNSEQTKICAQNHLAGLVRMPEMAVAYLGISNTPPRMTDLPPDLDLSRPYFVTIGTIEPRKNHRLLLDIWASLTKNADAPRLFIVGRRGWRNEAVFQRLDGHSANVFEFGDLSDGAVAALLVGARALLFPSHAEG